MHSSIMGYSPEAELLLITPLRPRVCPFLINCLAFPAIGHLRPEMGHTTGTHDASEIRIYRGLRGVPLIREFSARLPCDQSG